MNKFVIPDGFLSQLNEFSKDGFILFLFNQNGDPEFYMTCDNSQSAMALHNYIDNWAAAIKEINTSNLIDGLSSISEINPSGSTDYDEGDEDQEGF